MPGGDETRLQSLHSFGVLDTSPEAVFDEPTRHAALACEAPVALLSLVDRERLYFKARVGFEHLALPRAGSFCQAAIEHGGLFVVEDARTHPLFADHPLVTGEPHLRFYAGVPLVAAEGTAIGTLCVIDVRPRPLSPAAGELLALLAQQVMLRLELRRSESLRDFTARTLDEALREELAVVRRVSLQLLPAHAAVTALMHAQRAEDLAGELSALRPAPLGLTRLPVDLAALLRGVLSALEADVPVHASGDCHGAWDADLLSGALSRLCEEALARGPLTAAVEGAAAEVTLVLGGAAVGIGDAAAWLASAEGDATRVVGRRLAQRVVVEHGGSIAARDGALRITLPR